MIKKAFMFFLMIGAICFVGQHLGCSRSNEQAISAYKQFMDYWIVQDYTRALPYTTGDAFDKVEPETILKSKAWNREIKRPPGGYGIIEASTIKVLSEKQSDNRTYLDVVYSASISWDGSTANPMSPGSWTHYNQKAIMEEVGGAWKVASFSGEGSNVE